MLGFLHGLKQQLNIYKGRLTPRNGVIFADSQITPGQHPSIFINTLPKSGSIFIRRSLQGSARLKSQKLAYGYFPNDLIDYHKIRSFSKGGKIAQEHIDANPLNLVHLERFVKRWVIHLRDPRGSLLSWVHHLDRLHREAHHHAVQASSPFLPQEYFRWELHQKIDWQIEHYLKQAVIWIRDWGEYHARHPGAILVTTHTDLSADAEEVIKNILRFHGMHLPKVKLVEKSMYNHFRKGETAEWKRVYTPAQQARALQICAPLYGVFSDADYLVE